jgi:dephospho-CoA kinase
VFSVGLTGNVASGKSLVAQHFADWGATVVDADQLVHEVQSPGSPVLKAIAERFGSAVVSPVGELRRDRLRAIILGDAAARADLNAIVHPAVQSRRATLLEAARTRGDLVVVNDIPLLFEVLDPADFDLIVLVDAPAAMRRDRLITLRGLSSAEADRLMAVQNPSDDKRARSHIVVKNVTDLEALEDVARTAWGTIRQHAAMHATQPDQVLLAITAHHDDVQLITGTLHRYVDAGTAVHHVCATGMPKAIPGVSTVALERPGALQPNDDRAVTTLVGILQRVRPRSVITFGPDGGNGDADHRAVHEWTRRAIEGARSTARVYHVAAVPTGSPSELSAAIDVRPWRRGEGATTACGMAFDPRPRNSSQPGREWYGGSTTGGSPLTDLFPPADAVDRPKAPA